MDDQLTIRLLRYIEELNCRAEICSKHYVAWVDADTYRNIVDELREILKETASVPIEPTS